MQEKKLEILNRLNEIIESKEIEEKNRLERIIKYINPLNEHKKITAKILINELYLEKITTNEDGYYREFVNTIKDTNVESQTEIFYLLETNQVSCLHSLKTTETWTWLGGVPISIFIFKNFELEKITLNKTKPIYTIEEGLLFGAKLNDLNDDNDFGLVTCLCKPGFVPEHYSNPTADELKKLQDKYGSIIDELTPKILKKPIYTDESISSDAPIYKNPKNNFMQSMLSLFTSCIRVKKNENEEETSLINLPQNNR